MLFVQNKFQEIKVLFIFQKMLQYEHYKTFVNHLKLKCKLGPVQIYVIKFIIEIISQLQSPLFFFI